MTEWQDNQPIFRQLADKVTQQILEGIWLEGAAVPSVRSVAADLKINHLTVMKGYQLLVDEGLLEKRRGQGMFVVDGAVMQLKQSQRASFLQQELPIIATKLNQLDISLEEFISELTPYIERQL